MNLRLHFQLKAYLGDGRLWELSSPLEEWNQGFLDPNGCWAPPWEENNVSPLGEIPEYAPASSPFKAHLFRCQLAST